MEIEKLACERGLFVGVEYHKRFDRRSLMARRQYALGHFGEFVMGEAKLIEPYYYRHSNFQNWFTCDKTDPFVYVGCHYVDLVYFITGLKPVGGFGVRACKGKFPNGNEGYLWANGRVRYENGALLSVTDGLGYPDDGRRQQRPGPDHVLRGPSASRHDPARRPVTAASRTATWSRIGCGGSHYNYVSPDFFRLVPWEGAGLQAGRLRLRLGRRQPRDHAPHRERAAAGLPTTEALDQRREMIAPVDRQGIIATPANSFINELVVEAARLSILTTARGSRSSTTPARTWAN